MDETALIAFGILMEETARDVLGETGDLAFLEGSEDGGEITSPRQEEEIVDGPRIGLQEVDSDLQDDREVSNSSSLLSGEES